MEMLRNIVIGAQISQSDDLISVSLSKTQLGPTRVTLQCRGTTKTQNVTTQDLQLIKFTELNLQFTQGSFSFQQNCTNCKLQSQQVLLYSCDLLLQTDKLNTIFDVLVTQNVKSVTPENAPILAPLFAVAGLLLVVLIVLIVMKHLRKQKYKKPVAIAGKRFKTDKSEKSSRLGSDESGLEKK